MASARTKKAGTLGSGLKVPEILAGLNSSRDPFLVEMPRSRSGP